MTRKDAWTNEEDHILTKVILTSIANGETQLHAFEEVGLALQRTSAACGFRWNATVRHRVKKEIVQAKLQKASNKKGIPLVNTTLKIDDVIFYLQTVENELKQFEMKKVNLIEKIHSVSLEIEARRSEITLNTSQNTQALALLFSKAEELGLSKHNKKPAI